ncbi:MAG: DEAD/DEAH box helicase [Gammaproteobacteria bacterium]|nr:MAG: DEAD/DEAH box helicase [Gammaproteobacteria bacterium]
MSSPDFPSLGIASPVLQAVQALGYEQPSPIQAQSIPVLLEGANLLGIAQTGTGKTAAFALPLLSRLDSAQKAPQVLVLTPTRELAIQVAEAFQSYARHLKGFHVLPIYGGQDMRGQLRGLQRGAQVIVGTPGRILDHLRRRSLDLGKLKALVLDEADEMLRMGFIDDVETILAETPQDCQRALFSATMPPAIRRVVSKYLGDAKEVSIASKTRTVERISQRYLMVQGRHKMDALTRILEVEEFDGMIIFVRTKSATVEIAEKLEARGFSAAALNGDLSQALRERTINRLKKGQVDIVVATDVAARGLDVERISHVVNYDIPYDNEAYVHRIGRTGRAGREGQAILFVAPKERRLLRSIEQSTGQAISSMELPTGEEVSNQRVAQFQQRILKHLETEDLDSFRELLEKMAHDRELSMSDIAASLAWQLQQERPLFPKLAHIETGDRGRKGDHDSSREPRNPRERAEKRRERPEKSQEKRKHRDEFGEFDMVTYRIEVGKNQGVTPGDIVGAIANEADIESRYIGHIKLYDDYSTVDLPEGMPKELYDHLKNKVRVCQHPMRLSRPDEASQQKPSSNRGKSPAKGKKFSDKGAHPKARHSDHKPRKKRS